MMNLANFSTIILIKLNFILIFVKLTLIFNSLDSNKVRNSIENFDFLTQISQEKAFQRCVSKSFQIKIKRN